MPLVITTLYLKAGQIARQPVIHHHIGQRMAMEALGFGPCDAYTLEAEVGQDGAAIARLTLLCPNGTGRLTFGFKGSASEVRAFFRDLAMATTLESNRQWLTGMHGKLADALPILAV